MFRDLSNLLFSSKSLKHKLYAEAYFYYLAKKSLEEFCHQEIPGFDSTDSFKLTVTWKKPKCLITVLSSRMTFLTCLKTQQMGLKSHLTASLEQKKCLPLGCQIELFFRFLDR